MGIITLSHTPAGRSMPFLYPAEVAVSLLAPPLCYLWVLMVVQGRSRVPRTALPHFLIPAAWSAFAVVTLLRGRDVSEDIAPIEAVMAFQMAYTCFAAWRAFGQSPRADARADEVVLARPDRRTLRLDSRGAAHPIFLGPPRHPQFRAFHRSGGRVYPDWPGGAPAPDSSSPGTKAESPNTRSRLSPRSTRPTAWRGCAGPWNGTRSSSGRI